MPTHDIEARRIALVGAAIAVVVVLAVVAVFLLLGAWGLPARTDRVRLPYQAQVEAPRLQSAPQTDLARYRAEKQRILGGEARVDGQAGAAAMSIDAAMASLAREPAAPPEQAGGRR